MHFGIYCSFPFCTVFIIHSFIICCQRTLCLKYIIMKLCRLFHLLFIAQKMILIMPLCCYVFHVSIYAAIITICTITIVVCFIIPIWWSLWLIFIICFLFIHIRQFLWFCIWNYGDASFCRNQLFPCKRHITTEDYVLFCRIPYAVAFLVAIVPY